MKVEGKELISHYLENPERRRQKMSELCKLKEELVDDYDLGNGFKNSMLSSINDQIDILNGNPQSNEGSEEKSENKKDHLKYLVPGITFLIGVVISAVGGHYLDKKLKEYQTQMREDNVKTVVETLKEFDLGGKG